MRWSDMDWFQQGQLADELRRRWHADFEANGLVSEERRLELARELLAEKGMDDG